MGKYASILGLVDHESPSSAPGMAAQPAAAVPPRSLAALCAVASACFDCFFSSNACHSFRVDPEHIQAHQRRDAVEGQ